MASARRQEAPDATAPCRTAAAGSAAPLPASVLIPGAETAAAPYSTRLIIAPRVYRTPCRAENYAAVKPSCAFSVRRIGRLGPPPHDEREGQQHRREHQRDSGHAQQPERGHADVRRQHRLDADLLPGVGRCPRIQHTRTPAAAPSSAGARAASRAAAAPGRSPTTAHRATARSRQAPTAAHTLATVIAASGGAQAHGLEMPVTLTIAPRTFTIIPAITACPFVSPGIDAISRAWSTRMCGPSSTAGTSNSTAPSHANPVSDAPLALHQQQQDHGRRHVRLHQRQRQRRACREPALARCISA